MHINNSSKLSGFTLVEMIVVVACLAVIVTLSVGDINKMFNKQIAEQEKLDLQEIKKALELYAKNEGSLPINTALCDYEESLPSDSNIWSKELAKYSNMQADRICFDQWGRARIYLTKQIQQNFRSGDYSYKVYFSSVLSEGLNKQKDTDDWINITGASGFSNYEPAGDDLMVKYNDSDNKLKLYEETLERIDFVEQSLERYLRSKRAFAMSSDIPQYDNYIMYPKDGRTVDPGDYFDSTSVTGLSDENGVATIDESIKATALTKILGIPEYNGQNAITGESMWYISNPGPNRAKPCDNSRSSAPFYPPAIFVTTDDAIPEGC
jgi:prepilin-type N-terminal cleavage/methylation domain-containing protein